MLNGPRPAYSLDSSLPLSSLALAISVAVVGAWGCSDERPLTPPDGGPDAPFVPDAAGDLRSSVQAVDFTIGGCAHFEPGTPTCRGPAPLTVSFIPISSGNVSRLLWDFGDLSAPSSEPLPSHTYPLPGAYSVTLTGAPGQVYKRHDDVVVVTPNAFGDSCDVESQCDTGLECLCGMGAPCPAAFARGVCARRCGDEACPDGGFCADLALGTVPGSADDNPWRDRHCLRRCALGSDCPAGQRCRLVPTAGVPGRWEKACFYGFPAELGASCRGAGGATQNNLCLGGLCADLGALGMCSADCSNPAVPCPEGTGCAAFADGRRLCLRGCSDGNACTDDPLLTCTAPGNPGPLGFTLAGAAPGATFCAPRGCTSDVVCGPSGTCRGAPAAGQCVRR